MKALTVPVSAGELLDKITILEIKRERLRDEAQLANVRRELSLLREAADRELPKDAALSQLEAELRSVNETLWDLENTVRAHNRAQDFGPQFVEAARSIYTGNDRRAAIKRQINVMLGSLIVEEKSHDGA